MKWFIFSDPHGNLTALKQGLHKSGYNEHNKEHMLLGLGDYFDRGSENLAMLNFLHEKLKAGRARLLLGNHDAFLLDYLKGKSDGLFDMTMNGMLNTVNELAGTNISKDKVHLVNNALKDVILSTQPHLVTMLEQMQDFYQIGKYVFTHAGMTSIVGEWGIDNWANTPRFVKNYDPKDKIYVFGHWSAMKLKKLFNDKTDSPIFTYKNFIGLDGTTTLTNEVPVMVIEE